MNGYLDSLIAGQIHWSTVPAWIILALLFGMAGGALGGLRVGGAALGRQLAMMMGAFYGPFAALPGTILALIVLAIV